MKWPLIKFLPEKTNFKFVRFAKFAGVFSVVAVIASLWMTLTPFQPPCGGLTCGVDFKGGTVMEISTAPKPADLGQIRSVLNDMNLSDVQVQAFGGPTDVLVRFEPGEESPAVVVQRVQSRLSQEIEGVAFTRTEAVGPKVSGELFQSGVLALGVAILMMLFYIWFRFEFQFGLGAVAGLFHDVILTFGLFALTGMEFTLTSIAAILTIIGYSMNDTVVVFDRLRENLRKYKKMPLAEVIDLSVNETLSRTILTGVTTLLGLVVIALLGGEVLQSFAIALIFGVLIGTYSSVYIAAPIILLWGVKRGEDDEPEVIDLSKGTRSQRA